jgi:hypothetical protein
MPAQHKIKRTRSRRPPPGIRGRLKNPSQRQQQHCNRCQLLLCPCLRRRLPHRNKQYDAPNAAMMACTKKAATSSTPVNRRRASSTATIAARISPVASARGCRYWSVKLSPVPETGRVSKTATSVTAAHCACASAKHRRAILQQPHKIRNVAPNCQNKIG